MLSHVCSVSVRQEHQDKLRQELRTVTPPKVATIS